MNRIAEMLGERNRTVPLLVAVGFLLVGLLYILGFVYAVPHPGFSYDGRWQIAEFDTDCAVVGGDWCAKSAGLLEERDTILAITGPDGTTLTREEYAQDPFVMPFAGIEAEAWVDLRIERDGEILDVRWPMEGPTTSGILERLGGLLLFLPFWLAGTIVLLFFRPRNARWYLLILFNYLTGLWLAVGSIAITHILGSFFLLILISWLLMPIYLHLHMLIPDEEPKPRHRRILIFLYAAAILIGVLEGAGVLAMRSYYLALLVGIGGSLIILIGRLIQPSSSSVRAATTLMFTGILVALMPGLVFWLVPRLAQADTQMIVTNLSTLAVPLLPLFYTYALYKHRMGNLEVRANRALTLYSFLILYATAFVLVFVTVSQRAGFDPGLLVFSLVFSSIFMLLAFLLRPPFERYINRLAYGTSYDPDTIVQQFANEIPRALNRENLSMLLKSRVMPSLLIRQSALLWLPDPDHQLVYWEGIETPMQPATQEEIDMLLGVAGRYLTPEEALPAPFAWVRLVIPLELDQEAAGIWLLGRRDPDDYYPQVDIDLLATLGSQISVALETSRLFSIQQQRTAELEEAYLNLSRANRLKNDFIRNISHELRTPLTAISGYTDLLMAGDAGEMTEMQQELLDIVASRSQDLIQMINDIIAFQQTKLRKEDGENVDMVALARSAVRNAQLLADKDAAWQARPHQLDFDSSSPSLLVWASTTQLGQVFNNLLQNAVKFSPNGGKVRVCVWQGRYVFDRGQDGGEADGTQPDQGHGDETEAVFVSVSDEGIGIAESELDNIWLDFYQIDASATRRFGGTGLGLALVKDIVEGYGGDIWVESTLGMGSTFTFVLPAQPAATEELAI